MTVWLSERIDLSCTQSENVAVKQSFFSQSEKAIMPQIPVIPTMALYIVGNSLGDRPVSHPYHDVQFFPNYMTSGYSDIVLFKFGQASVYS